MAAHEDLCQFSILLFDSIHDSVVLPEGLLGAGGLAAGLGAVESQQVVQLPTEQLYESLIAAQMHYLEVKVQVAFLLVIAAPVFGFNLQLVLG